MFYILFILITVFTYLLFEIGMFTSTIVRWRKEVIDDEELQQFDDDIYDISSNTPIIGKTIYKLYNRLK